MAVHNDYDGVYFTIQALNIYHNKFYDDLEIIVVDNKPSSLIGKAIKRHVDYWIPNGRYIPFDEVEGTSATRELIFREAKSPLVMCIDSHVLLHQNVIENLLKYYEDHPETGDLIQGPMIYDDLTLGATHMNPIWSDNMFGTWAVNPIVHMGEPFEIVMHGLGLFSCRKDAWQGFNPNFRGFGGEEGYIHEKFRQAGCKTICLPSLRWSHRFAVKGLSNSYRNILDDRFRNYLIGWTELNLDIRPVIEHFKDVIKPISFMNILGECNIDFGAFL